MKQLLLVFSFFLLINLSGTASATFLIDFEDGIEGSPVNDIAGINFQSFNGFSPRYGDSRTGRYSTTSDDLGYGSGQFHHNGNLWLWAGSGADARGVKLYFTNDDGTWFQTGYSSMSSFYIDAYLTDGSVVTASSAANTGAPMDFLRIDAAAGSFIDYVVLHDSGNMWLADDMSGDTSGVGPTPTVPEPTTAILFGIGLLRFAGVPRKKQQSS